ncbi:unnamed protein product [Effrenium voratum]|nr:unnamed protein product [Effrenium voratum]
MDQRRHLPIADLKPMRPQGLRYRSSSREKCVAREQGRLGPSSRLGRFFLCDSCRLCPELGEVSEATRRKDLQDLREKRLAASLRHPSEIFALAELGLFTRLAQSPAQARNLVLDLGQWLASEPSQVPSGLVLVELDGAWCEAQVVGKAKDDVQGECWVSTSEEPRVLKAPLARLRPAFGEKSPQSESGTLRQQLDEESSARAVLPRSPRCEGFWKEQTCSMLKERGLLLQALRNNCRAPVLESYVGLALEGLVVFWPKRRRLKSPKDGPLARALRGQAQLPAGPAGPPPGFSAELPAKVKDVMGANEAFCASLDASADSWVLLLRKWLPSGELFERLWNRHPPDLGKGKLFGKEVTFHRYQQSFGADYAFSGQTAHAHPLTQQDAPEVWHVLQQLQKLLALAPPLKDRNYGACLVNWYDGGKHSMGFHSDDERGLVAAAPIFAISWGCTRTFRLAPKKAGDGHKVDVEVHDGDLIVMGGACQRSHKHAIPASAKTHGRFFGRHDSTWLWRPALAAMFLPAPRTFSLSEETKASIKARGTSKVASAAKEKLLRAARKARQQIQSQWRDFQPEDPKLATTRRYDVETDGWVEEQVMIQLDSKAFGKGAVRECFRMKEVRLDTRLFSGEGRVSEFRRLSFAAVAAGLMELPRASTGASCPQSFPCPLNQHFVKRLDFNTVKGSSRRTLWVAKRSIEDHHRKIMHRRECETDVIHQTFAKHYAELFNQEVHRQALETGLGRCGAHDIDFLLTHVVELPERVTFSAEAFVSGEYLKHNTNGGSIIGARTTPQAFSYFTFVKSGRRLMIVDIQGVVDLYTDPVIHFLPSKVSGKLAGADMELNFGIRGFALFLWSHRRNDVDQLLKLPVFSLSPHEEKYLEPTSRTVTQLIEATKSRKSQPPPQQAFHVGYSNAILRRMAECHMEIAAMYHEGEEDRGEPRRPEVESAVFHVVEAARQDLPEALMALARLASQEEHPGFLPQVLGASETNADDSKGRSLVLALLGRAATLGAKHAMAALAAEVLRGDASQDELQLAADHLEEFAMETLEELRAKEAKAAEQEESEEEEEDDEEEVDQEHNSLHRRSFGWEVHGFDAWKALRRVAELYEGPLKEAPDALKRAAELRRSVRRLGVPRAAWKCGEGEAPLRGEPRLAMLLAERGGCWAELCSEACCEMAQVAELQLGAAQEELPHVEEKVGKMKEEREAKAAAAKAAKEAAAEKAKAAKEAKEAKEETQNGSEKADAEAAGPAPSPAEERLLTKAKLAITDAECRVVEAPDAEAKAAADACKRMARPRPRGDWRALLQSFAGELLAPMLAEDGGVELDGRFGQWLGVGTSEPSPTPELSDNEGPAVRWLQTIRVSGAGGTGKFFTGTRLLSETVEVVARRVTAALAEAAGPSLQAAMAFAARPEGAKGRNAGRDVDLSRLGSKAELQQVQSALAPVLSAWREEPRQATQLLAQLAKAKRARTSWKVLDVMEMNKLETNAYHFGAALSACAADWPLALALLRRARDAGGANVVVFNAAISCCAKGSAWAAAFGLLRQLDLSQLQRDLLGYSGALSACSLARQWQHALGLLADMATASLRQDAISYNSVISACEGPQWPLALHFLRAMRRQTLQPTVVTYNTVMAACPNSALGLLQTMQGEVLEPDVISYGSAISAGDWHLALHLLSSMLRSQLVPDIVCYNSVMTACTQCSRWPEALALLGLCQKSSTQKDAVTFNAAISCCEASGQWHLALHFFGQALEAGQVTAVTYNAAIAACSSRWDLGLQLLHAMEVASFSPDVVSFGSAISACAQQSLWTSALHLLTRMPHRALDPNVVTFTAAVSACHNASEWAAALRLLRLMRSTKVEPNTATYNSAIAACHDGNCWQQAVELLARMEATQVVPDVSSYSALIGSCFWANALALLEHMADTEVAPNVSSFRGAFESLLRAGQFGRMPALLWAVAQVEAQSSAGVSGAEI